MLCSKTQSECQTVWRHFAGPDLGPNCLQRLSAVPPMSLKLTTPSTKSNLPLSHYPHLSYTQMQKKGSPVPIFFLLERIGLHFRWNGSQFSKQHVIPYLVYLTGGVMHVLLYREVTQDIDFMCFR